MKKFTNEEIIDDFIQGTPSFVENMRRMTCISKIKNGTEDFCVYCGVSPQKMLDLSIAVQELRTKN